MNFCVSVSASVSVSVSIYVCVSVSDQIVCTMWRGGGLGSSTIFKNLMSPTPRRKWYLTTGRRAHYMVLDPIPQPLPVHFFGSRPQPPTSHDVCVCVRMTMRVQVYTAYTSCVCVYMYT